MSIPGIPKRSGGNVRPTEPRGTPMSGLFGSKKMPPVPEPVKPPTTDDAKQAEEEIMRLRRRRGRASTFLAGKSRPSRAASFLGQVGTATSGASSGGGGTSGSNGGGSGSTGRTSNK